MAGASAERQEQGVIDAIRRCVRTNGNKPITVVGANGKKVLNVVDVDKHSGRTISGSEPYTDVIIHTTSKKYNVSNKGESAPSLAGGGLSGIETILPGLVKKFLVEGVKQYTKKKYKTGDAVPELFGLIDSSDVKKLLRGNKDVGGPIDFMYIGPMDVDFEYKDGVCTLNGNFYSIDDYYKKVGGKLYIRARKRREDQLFTKDEVDKEGLPLIYGKSKTKSDKGRRIVVTDKAPSTAITYNIPKVGK
jgi:hypothetical protein